jgi:hypothetical protein
MMTRLMIAGLCAERILSAETERAEAASGVILDEGRAPAREQRRPDVRDSHTNKVPVFKGTWH